MADQIATRYGILPRDLTHAALQTIVLTTADGIDALDEAHDRLQRVGIPDAHAAHPTPRRRWEQLLRNLFPVSILVVDPHGSASPDLVSLPTGSDADERAARRLLSAAAAFLLAETIALEDAVELSQHWAASDPAGADGSLDTAETILGRATQATRTLLDYAESGRWRDLLATYVPKPRRPVALTLTPPEQGQVGVLAERESCGPSGGSGPTTAGRERLALELRRLRDLAALSGRELGRRIGISQSKVSRIESGITRPSRTKVTAWGKAVGVSVETQEQLIALTESAYSGAIHLWMAALHRANRLHSIQEQKLNAAWIKAVPVSLVPGLLQTAVYARRVFATYRWQHFDTSTVTEIACILKRQLTPYDTDRQLECPVTDAALHWWPSPAQLLQSSLYRLFGQAHETLGRLDEVATRLVSLAEYLGAMRPREVAQLDGIDSIVRLRCQEMMHRASIVGLRRGVGAGLILPWRDLAAPSCRHQMPWSLDEPGTAHQAFLDLVDWFGQARFFDGTRFRETRFELGQSAAQASDLSAMLLEQEPCWVATSIPAAMTTGQVWPAGWIVRPTIAQPTEPHGGRWARLLPSRQPPFRDAHATSDDDRDIATTTQPHGTQHHRTTRPDGRLIAALVPHQQALTRLLDLLPLVEVDYRVQVVFVTPVTESRSSDVTDSILRLGGLLMPWQQAQQTRFDLILATTTWAIHELIGPVMLMPPGTSIPASRFAASDEQMPRDLHSRALIHGGDAVPAALTLTHDEELDRLDESWPEAVPRAVVVGDLSFDRMLASQRLRQDYRQTLEVSDSRRLVVISATSPHSLFAINSGLFAQFMVNLPADHYQVIGVLHPSIWYEHGRRQVLAWLDEALAIGLNMVAPGEDWRAAIVSADLVVGDHGSITQYAAGLNIPVLLNSHSLADASPSRAADYIERQTVRLHPDRPLLPQVEMAIATHSAQPDTAVADLLTSRPGQAGTLLRRTAYQLLDMPEPTTPVRISPVPPPRAIPQQAGVVRGIHGSDTRANDYDWQDRGTADRGNGCMALRPNGYVRRVPSVSTPLPPTPGQKQSSVIDFIPIRREPILSYCP